MDAKQRRPTMFEIMVALVMAMVRQILSDGVPEGGEQISTFLQGPLRDSFMTSLDVLVSENGEHAILDKHDGLLIRRG